MTKSGKTKRLAELAEQIKVCIKCPLHESRTLAVPGDGKLGAKVMIVAEAPGKDEDLTGHPFVGASGKFLNSVLEGSGLDRDDFFITNTVKCRPPKNRTPKRDEIETCTDNYLFEQIELINPRLLMLLGGVAAKRVLGIKTINEARGQVIERGGRKHIVGYHPAVRFYREDLKQKVYEDFELLKKEIEKL
ncbi:MAG TPA: uracil-DNA glycosylase [Blastocatellia bacterium]|nr:uracil-DNA glycosylase [Blastocatellia bacterium]